MQFFVLIECSKHATLKLLQNKRTRATVMLPSFLLFYCYRLCQVAGLVNILALTYSNMIS